MDLHSQEGKAVNTATAMGSSGMSRHGRNCRQRHRPRRYFSVSESSFLLMAAIALTGFTRPSTNYATAVTTKATYHLRGINRRHLQEGETEPKPDAVEEGVIEEIAHLEEEIEDLVFQDDDAAKLEQTTLESVEDELIEAALPPGCDLDCFFDNRPGFAKSHDNTEEAVLDHYQELQRQIPSHACDCKGGAPIVGDPAPEPGAVAEAAIEEIVHVGEEIEDLENQDGESAELEKEVLESVEAALIEAALPPGCNLDCFFDNHPMFADRVEHTEEAVLDFSQKHNPNIPIPSDACDCHGETAVIEEIGNLEEEIEGLASQDDDSAKLEKEVLESVEDELIGASLPPGCDLDCFFDNHDKLASKIENTEEAVLDFFQKQNQEIPSNACYCQGDPPSVGDPAPEPGAVEEGAIEEIVHVEEEIEALENQDDDGAELEKNVLESVQEELIRAALPPGCNLDCFFENHKYVANNLENTEEMLEYFQTQMKGKLPSHACDCQGETASAGGLG